MDNSPEVPDFGQYIEDTVTLSGDPKRLITKKMTNAYTKAALAAATALPLALGTASMGPIPVVSQQQSPVNRPDEHIASQTQQNDSLVAGKLAALVSGGPTPNFFWSGNDAAPFWSGNDFAPFARSRAEMVRRWRTG